MLGGHQPVPWGYQQERTRPSPTPVVREQYLITEILLSVLFFILCILVKPIRNPLILCTIEV